ncbi:hypothetical protein Q0P29_14670, partial [Staphylococcus aureus]|nr:hypothetical protein [Staphylococcus aureus]
MKRKKIEKEMRRQESWALPCCKGEMANRIATEAAVNGYWSMMVKGLSSCIECYWRDRTAYIS